MGSQLKYIGRIRRAAAETAASVSSSQFALRTIEVEFVIERLSL